MESLKREHVSASFSARYVPMLAKWAMNAAEYEQAFYQQRSDRSGLQIEPAPEGGVYLIATNDHRIARVHDALGHCDQPLILSLPDEFINACRPVSGPKAVPVEGGAMYSVKLPTWLQPHKVIINLEVTPGRTDPFWIVMVTSGVIPPEHRDTSRSADEQEGFGFYKSSCLGATWRDATPQLPGPDRPLVPHETILSRPSEAVPFTILTAQTAYLSDLQYLGDAVELFVDKRTQAVFARFLDTPEITAAIMPMRGQSDEERARETASYEERIRTGRLDRMETKGAPS